MKQIHKNAQATTVLLASLCRDEYNKVSGLDNAKQIWDTLKISHEGNNVTMITKIELVEGELGRFTMKRGEEPTKTYNRLKTLVNKIQSYGSTRWTEHDVVRLMLRSFTVIDPHLVNLIRENPRYTKMTPEEIPEKFVSGRMMVKEARYVDDIANGPLPLYKPHGGSCHNLVIREMVEKLGLKLQRHPHPYHVQWLNESGDIKIGYKVKVPFKTGEYVDTVECDVAPMSMCHLLLGRPWQYDRYSQHCGRTNQYTLDLKGRKFVLKPMTSQQIMAET
jgi:hypothetical protein